MVCSKCQAKLTKVVTPDPWKSQGSGPSGGASGSGHRKLNENKALSKTSRFTPYSVSQKCRLCNQKVHQKGSFYCQGQYLVMHTPLALSSSLRID